VFPVTDKPSNVSVLKALSNNANAITFCKATDRLLSFQIENTFHSIKRYNQKNREPWAERPNYFSFIKKCVLSDGTNVTT